MILSEEPWRDGGGLGRKRARGDGEEGRNRFWENGDRRVELVFILLSVVFCRLFWIAVLCCMKMG